jgi:M6 family metalloprotease-like protein
MKQGISIVLSSILALTGCSGDANSTSSTSVQGDTQAQVEKFDQKLLLQDENREYTSLSVAVAVPKFSTKALQGKHLTKPLGTSEDITTVFLKVIDDNGVTLASDVELTYQNGAYTGEVPELPINERLNISVSAFNDSNLEIFKGDLETVLVNTDSNAVSLTMYVLNDGKDITIPRLTKIVVGESKMHFYVDDNGSTPTLDFTLLSNDNELSFVQTNETVVLEDGSYVIEVDYNASDYGTYTSDFVLENTLGGKLSTTFSTTIADTDDEGNFSVSLAPVISGIHIIRNGEDLIVDVDASDDGGVDALSYEWSFNPIYDGGSVQSFVDNRVNPATILGYNENVTGYLNIKITDTDGASSETEFTIRQNQFPDYTAPRLLSTTPNSGAIGIDVTDAITLTFDEVMGDVNENTLMITPEVAFSVASSDNKTYTLTPNETLAYDTVYVVTMTNDVTDVSDNNFNAQSISFTTQADENDQNSAPVANYTGFTTPLNQEYNASVTATDVDGDDLTFAKVSDPTHGTLSLTQNGSFSYAPTNGYTGSDTFVYKANDGKIDSNEQSVTINVGDVVEGTQLPLLLIRVEFNDFKFHNDATTWSNKIFGTSEGELNHYYDEISYGEFQFAKAIESDGVNNDGIVTVLLNENHPGDGDIEFIPRLVSAINASDSSINFSQYDKNGDAKLSKSELQVMFIVAGGEAAYGDAPAVWAHAWCIRSGTAPIVDGVAVSECGTGGYSRFGERQGDHDATIGVIAHELGHAAHGLPDLYDTSGNSRGIGLFGLMATGSWASKPGDLYAGTTPTHMSAWGKHVLGWGETIEANGTTDYSLKSNDMADFNMIKITTADPREYFLVENRSINGYDRALNIIQGAYNGGLAIWHIDENQFSNSNENHKLVDLEEMNDAGLDTRAHRGHANNLMFAGNATEFTRSTTPNSNNYSNTATGIEITNASIQGEVMTLTVKK